VALFLGVSLMLGGGAGQAPTCLTQAQYAEDDEGERDGGDERVVPRRADPESEQPSEDGTDGPPMGRDAPVEPPGCIFKKDRPLELLV
jgi:hypothetical protein